MPRYAGARRSRCHEERHLHEVRQAPARKFSIDIPIEGRSVRTKLTAIRLNASDCGEQPVVVAVDDQLVRRAGNSPDGKPVDVISGTTTWRLSAPGSATWSEVTKSRVG